MEHHTDAVALVVFVLLFGLVTVLGFVAARWRAATLASSTSGASPDGASARSVTWFLLGGDLYTAYTFIAVPALVFGAGALGFFALPYTIMVYPLVFLVLAAAVVGRAQPRLRHARRLRRGRFEAVAGPGGRDHRHPGDDAVHRPAAGRHSGGDRREGIGIGDLPWSSPSSSSPLTPTSGLRAPAMIALVKDVLIYVTVIVAVDLRPVKLGGYGGSSPAAGKACGRRRRTAVLLAPAPAYATLALGSALALFLYPHAMTGVLSANSQHVRRNAAILPAYRSCSA